MLNLFPNLRTLDGRGQYQPSWPAWCYHRQSHHQIHLINLQYRKHRNFINWENQLQSGEWREWGQNCNSHMYSGTETEQLLWSWHGHTVHESNSSIRNVVPVSQLFTHQCHQSVFKRYTRNTALRKLFWELRNQFSHETARLGFHGQSNLIFSAWSSWQSRSDQVNILEAPCQQSDVTHCKSHLPTY